LPAIGDGIDKSNLLVLFFRARPKTRRLPAVTLRFQQTENRAAEYFPSSAFEARTWFCWMRHKFAAQMKRRVIRICTDSEINGTEKPQRLSLDEQENRNHPNDLSTYKLCRPGSLQQEQIELARR
jgi:hypothetical protein